MDFGRLTQVHHVDFSLPADTEDTLRVLRAALAKRNGRADLRAYVGAPIWTPKEWVGTVYPKGTRPGDFLHHYSRQFGAIELNSTFYAIPDHKTVDSWREATPPGFRFCPKVHQEISQGLARDARGAAMASVFFETALRFGDRLGLCFLQLPPQLGPQPGLRALDDFFDLLPEGFPLAVEFRNARWFAGGALIDEAVRLLERRGLATVITDTAGRRDVSHASLTTPKVLVRFLGNEGHASDQTRIDDWAERIGRWKSLGLEELYFFAHEHNNALAPDLISKVIQGLDSPRCGLTVRDWERQEKQISLFG